MKKYLIIILSGLMVLWISFIRFGSHYREELHQYKEEIAEFFRVRLLEKVKNVSKHNSDVLQEKLFWEERVNELFKVDEKQRNEIDRLKKELAGVKAGGEMLRPVSLLETNGVEIKYGSEDVRIRNLLQENELLVKKLEEKENDKRQLSERYGRALDEIKRQLDEKSRELESVMAARNEVRLQDMERALAESERKLKIIQEEVEKAKAEKQNLLVLLKTEEDKARNYQEEMEAAEDKSKGYQEEILKLSKENLEAEKQVKKVEASSHYNYGVVYMQNKKYDEAISEYEKTLEIDANYPFALYNLGVLYDSYKKDAEKAVIHYGKYLQVMPDADDAAKVREWLKAAEERIGQ